MGPTVKLFIYRTVPCKHVVKPKKRYIAFTSKNNITKIQAWEKGSGGLVHIKFKWELRNCPSSSRNKFDDPLSRMGIIKLVDMINEVYSKHGWIPCRFVMINSIFNPGIIVINAVVFVIVLIVGCCVFDPAGGKYYKVLTAEDRISTSRSTMEQIRSVVFA